MKYLLTETSCIVRRKAVSSEIALGFRRRPYEVQSFVNSIWSSGFNFYGVVALALIYVVWNLFLSSVITPAGN